MDEARFLVQDLPRRERTLYLVLGFGLGYHVQQLLQRIPQSSHILILEPDGARLSSRAAHAANAPPRAWLSNTRLHFAALHDPAAAPDILADSMTRLRLLSLEIFPHIPSTLTAEIFYRALLALIPQKFPSSFYNNLNLIDKMPENDLLNFWANLPYSWNAAPIDSLHDLWANRPLIVVSAGPSLTGSLETLHAAGDRVLLFATGPAARILMNQGIRADLVLSLDPFEANLGHFQGWNTADTPLVYHHRIYRGVLPAHEGPKFCFLMQDEPPLPLSGTTAKSTMMRGGSVAFSALQLAHHLGANPIIFVGQDFAFANGHTHAAGSITDSIYDPDALPESYFQVPGIAGRTVVTNRIYYSYLVYMQDYLLNFSRHSPSVRHINCSPIGAMVRGMEYAALDRVLAGCVPADPPFAPELIRRSLQSSPPTPHDGKRTALSRWASDLTRILAHASGTDEFPGLFSKFRATALYAHAPVSYDDIQYLYQARYRSEDHSSNSVLPTRFIGHLKCDLHLLRAAEAQV